MTNEEIIKKIEEYNTNKKKTIAIFCDVFYPSIDGVITVVNNLAIELSAYYNVVVCVPKHKNETVFKDAYLVLGVNSSKIPGMDYECSFHPSKDKQFMKYLNMLKIDLIHFHSPFFMGKFAAKYAKEKNIPLVCTLHSQYRKDFWNTTHSKLLTKILLSRLIKVFNKAELCFTMNSFCESVGRDYGIKIPITLIPNATNWTATIDKSMCDEVTKKYGLESAENIWLFVGRFVKVKNLPMTIKVLKALKDKNMNFKFICVGEGSQLPKLKAMTKKFGLENNVIFTGKITNRSELEAIYALTNLFIFTSNYDMESIVVQEASSKSVPTIMIEKTGPAARVVADQNGYLCKNCVESFANKIEEISKDKKQMKAVGENAQKTLLFSWSQVAKQYKDKYEEIMKKKKS